MPDTSDTCATVTIVTKNGEVEINKSDYDADPKAYTLAGKTAPKKKAK